jgi:hypothetical protein
MTIDDLKQNAVHELKPSGYIIVDGQEVAHTKQCCHCNAHFVSIKGSGKIRGHCMLCNAITCGAPACDFHIPFEAKLELTEGTKNRWQDQAARLIDKYGNPL